jgi:hypothetical protein
MKVNINVHNTTNASVKLFYPSRMLNIISIHAISSDSGFELPVAGAHVGVNHKETGISPLG